MIDVRGTKDPHKQICVVKCFTEYLETLKIPLNMITKKEIDNFIIEQATYYKKKTLASISSFLRVFFRFLVVDGIQSEDLSCLVERPRIVQGERESRYLKNYQISSVLCTPNSNTVVGIRDRTILTLLAVYGLRACEIAAIQLEDIRWRAQILKIHHRKCNDILELPLIQSVASALAKYLQVRPSSNSREVFLKKYKPYHKIKAASVSNAARLAIYRAGIKVNRPGSHTFRYSCAQTFFQKETPLSEIANALGHKDLRTTLGYLQITVHPLREVAQNDGEDMI